MCGIAGLAWWQAPHDCERVADGLVRRMAAELAHRGPDGEGFCTIGTRSEALGVFGHRRLAVVDEAGGAQPFVDGELSLVGNTEIYGHLELRRELEAHGARFHSRCDTEVILHGYRAWGDAVVERLDGMFAFALWDAAERRLLLARDRLGQKPLFWSLDADRFLFASEAAALVSARRSPAEICHDALARYLLLDFVPTPRSIFAGVTALEAGSMLVVEPGRAVTRARYFELPRAARPSVTRSSLVAELPALFDDAVDRRRMSDRPVGLFLSGGLDSTLVGATLARGSGVLHSYSVRFVDAGYDESPQAREAARWLGSNHAEVDMHAAQIPALATEVLGGIDEPLADASTLAVWSVSRRAREDVKVVLGGDGADELFGGYDVFAALRLERATALLGRGRARLLRCAADRVGGGDSHFSLDFQLRQFARGLELDGDVRAIGYTFNDAPDAILRRMAAAPADVDLLEDARIGGSDVYDAMFRAYQGLFLESNILRKVDRAGMAHGLEIRSPFLDHRLVELVARVPARRRLYGLASKPLLRDSLGDRVPRWVRRRRKHGFIVPIARWINRDLRSWFDEIVHERLPMDLVDAAAAAALLDEHRRGVVNHRKPLWNLAALTVWYEGFRARASAWGGV
jgi:asparagine synthase (glutamine-hydrolysing)